MNTMSIWYNICQESYINVQDVPNGSVSLRECFGKDAISGSQGLKRCGYTTGYTTLKCKCRREENLCNSKCHNSLSCTNKWIKNIVHEIFFHIRCEFCLNFDFWYHQGTQKKYFRTDAEGGWKRFLFHLTTSVSLDMNKFHTPSFYKIFPHILLYILCYNRQIYLMHMTSV